MLQLFCDMDGVLKNFVTASLLSHGRKDLADDISFPPIYNYWSEMGMEPAEFWKPIRAAGPDWWYNLKPYPWAAELAGLLNTIDPNWRICTTPDNGASSHGKKEWLAANLPGRRVHMTDAKFDLAGPGRVLIDDSEKNCDEWAKAGGTPFLFPASSNRLRVHFITGDPMAYVRPALRNLKEQLA